MQLWKGGVGRGRGRSWGKWRESAEVPASDNDLISWIRAESTYAQSFAGPSPALPPPPPVKRHINHGGRRSDVHVRTLFRPSPALHQTMGMPACAHAFRIATYNTARTPPSPSICFWLPCGPCAGKAGKDVLRKKKKKCFFKQKGLKTQTKSVTFETIYCLK